MVSEVYKLDRMRQLFLAALPAHLAQANAALLERIGFGREAGAQWPERFSPMVLGYPGYQTEAIDVIVPDAVRQAELAHLNFLVFSILDDRRRDGQVELTPTEIEFASWVFEQGLSILSQLISEPLLRQLSESILARDEYGHTKLNRLFGSGNHSVFQQRAIIEGRAYWGAFATLALLHAQSPAFISNVVKAFEALVWALQWVDDVEDWHEDLETQDDNLMLLELNPELLHSAGMLPSEIRRGVVAQAILTHSAISLAIQQARSAFGEAAAIQESLGCETLAGLIRERIEALASIETSAVKQCEQDVMVLQLVQLIATQNGNTLVPGVLGK